MNNAHTISLQRETTEDKGRRNSSVLPDSLVRHIDRLEESLVRGEISVLEKIAVFDLDNTLLVGDIGEAVFAQLELQGCNLSISWSEYRRMTTSNRPLAYRKIVEAMSGLSFETLVKATHKILACEEPFLQLEGNFIPVPTAQPLMLLLVKHLASLNFQTYVITSSNEVSARITTSQLFGIPESHVFGIRSRVVQDTLTADLVPPVPIDEGKVAVYRRCIGHQVPLITGGDSPLDVPLLRLTHPAGFSVWVGEERIGFELAKAKVAGSQVFHFIERRERSYLEQEGPEF